MKLNTELIKRQSREDYRRAWLETASLIPETGATLPSRKGSPHMMHELIQTVRRVFLDLGFDEVENQIFIPEEDVYKQYGPEAPVILDRCYYLAGLPRPDIGLSKEKIMEVQEIAGIRPESLKGIFRKYRGGDIEGDDVLETMVRELAITTDQATHILDLFPEFKNITPVAGKNTLRSHMTAAWFPTIAAMADEAPLMLFSVGLRFRREQKVDSSHLRAHYGGSCIIASEDISLDAGKKITGEILKALAFGDVRFDLKKATSNYYAPDTEYEVYSGDIEVADIGMYSPVALAEYGIEYNVFNLGFGMERILMVKNKIDDVRKVLYPQFYSGRNYADSQLAGEIRIGLTPETHEGIMLMDSLKKAFTKHMREPSPCRILAYEGDMLGKKIRAYCVEREENSSLAGPALQNEIFAYESGLYGIPKDTSKLKKDVSQIIDKGVKSSFGFIESVCALLAYETEKSVQAGNKNGFFQVKMAKGPADINIRVSHAARRFIESHNKPIILKGPVFAAAEYEII
jgi:O-phosphoseryl-tRNA synthetase